MNTKMKCVLTLKTGAYKWILQAYQSPRGIRHEGKRPDVAVIDCYQEFNQKQLFEFAKYIETIACAMGINDSNEID